ncbi:MAG: hypothetical protein ACMV1B_03310, partial [Prevotella sp.]
MNQNNQDKELLLELTKHLEYALLELWELQKDKISSEEYDNKYGYLLAMAKKADDRVMSLLEEKQVPKQQAQKQVATVSEDGNSCTLYGIKYERFDTCIPTCVGCVGNSSEV